MKAEMQLGYGWKLRTLLDSGPVQGWGKGLELGFETIGKVVSIDGGIVRNAVLSNTTVVGPVKYP